MLRKIIFLFLPLLLLISACKDEGKQPEMGIFSPSDLSVTANNFTLTCDAEMTKVLSSLGKDYEYAEAISCAYDGLDKTYTYKDFTIKTYPKGDKDYLLEVTVTTDKIVTEKKITVGSSLEEVFAAYGKEYTESGSLIEYICDEGCLFFEAENNKVVNYGITRKEEEQFA